MRSVLVHGAIIAAYYIVGAYATTDILRLLRGCDIPVNAAKCYCPICGKEIALIDQIPIVSYMINGGKCRNCKASIPWTDLFFEIFIFVIMVLITVLLGFRREAFWGGLVLYEGTKLIFILLKGRREKDFWRNMFHSLANNLVIFGIIFLLFVAESSSRTL